MLDTHALIWMVGEPKRLSKRTRGPIREARQGLARHNVGIAMATIPVWEIAWLAQNGRIAVTVSVESFVRETVARVILRPATPEIAALAVRWPDQFPKDLADRLIAATAMVEAMALVTADMRIRKSKLVETVW